jgi:hypothetical protein
MAEFRQSDRRFTPISGGGRTYILIDRAWFGLIECPLWPDSDQIPHRIEMTRCARGDIRDVKTLYRERHSSEPTIIAAETFAWLLSLISRRQIEPFDPARPLRNRQVVM